MPNILAGKSLDQKQGNRHPKYALRLMFFVVQDRFGTANYLHKTKTVYATYVLLMISL